MKPKRFLLVVAVFGVILILNSCGSSPAGCPVCGTDQNGTVALIDVMLVPEHNPNGEPGGPFNIFDIGWTDPGHRLYYITDRIGLDVPVFNTDSNIALWAIGGDNSVAEGGFNASPCWVDPVTGETIPSITTAQGNYTRFGCKTNGFRLPGGFGPDGNFGGFLGGQCCAARSNNLNPLTGPNGLEASDDGNFLFVGNGSASMVVFDMAKSIANNFNTPPTPPMVTAVIPTGTSPDYDGPNGIGPCQASANGRAFSDPTCGDLRGDELATTGSVVTFPQDGSSRFLVAIINGDPGLAFVSIIDATGIVTRSANNQKAHCLPYASASFTASGAGTQDPFSPGGPGSTFKANYASCILGQIYYDGAPQNDTTVLIDDAGVNAGISCPDPSLQFIGTPGVPGPAVPSGASGHAADFNPDVACHRGPLVRNSAPGTPTNGTFCPTPTSFPDCVGTVAFAGLGGMVYYPPTHTFLLTNGNATSDITVGSVDVIDPLHPITVGGVTKYVPAIINSFPIHNCMPTGLSLRTGTTDVLVGCADHDGRAFAPSSVIINGTTGAVLTTINNVGFVDQTWYNPGDDNYYLGARDMPTGPVLGIINAGTRQWLRNVPTNGNAHSVAVDPKNNHIFVPLPAGGTNCETIAADGCVGVYAQQ